MNTAPISDSDRSFAREQRSSLIPHSFDEETGHDTETLASRRTTLLEAHKNWEDINEEYLQIRHALANAAKAWRECNDMVENHQDTLGY